MPVDPGSADAPMSALTVGEQQRGDGAVGPQSAVASGLRLGISRQIGMTVAEMEPRWRVFIVADEPGARNALRQVLEAASDLKVVGDGEPNPATAEELLSKTPHVLVSEVGGSEQGV